MPGGYVTLQSPAGLHRGHAQPAARRADDAGQRAASSLRRHRPALAPAAAPGRVRRERAGGGSVAFAPRRQGEGTSRADGACGDGAVGRPADRFVRL